MTRKKVEPVRPTVFPITPTEATALIVLSDSEHAVELSFGSGLALFKTPENEWAVKVIQAMRKE